MKNTSLSALVLFHECLLYIQYCLGTTFFRVMMIQVGIILTRPRIPVKSAKNGFTLKNPASQKTMKPAKKIVINMENIC